MPVFKKELFEKDSRLGKIRGVNSIPTLRIQMQLSSHSVAGTRGVTSVYVPPSASGKKKKELSAVIPRPDRP